MDSSDIPPGVKSLVKQFQQNNSNASGNKYVIGPNVPPRTRKNPPHPEKGQQPGAQNNIRAPLSGGDQVAAQVKETDPPTDGHEKDSATIGEGGQSNSSGMAAANEQTSHDKSGGGTQASYQITEANVEVNDPHNAIQPDSATGAEDSRRKTPREIADPSDPSSSTDSNNDIAHVEDRISTTSEVIATSEHKSLETTDKMTEVEKAATGSTSPGGDQVEESGNQVNSSYSNQEDPEAKSVTEQLPIERQNDDGKCDEASRPDCGKETDSDDRTKDAATNEEGGQSNEKTPSEASKDDLTSSSETTTTEDGAIRRTSGDEIITKRDQLNQTPTDYRRNPDNNEDNSTSNCESSSSSDGIPEEPSELEPPTKEVSADTGDDPYASIYQRKLSCSVAEAFRDKSKQHNSGHPSIYYLKPREKTSDSQPLRWFTIGERNEDVKHKTILLVGATGSGKSTLVDAMVNYVLGVKWEDDFRFKIVPEEGNGNQAQSQTTFITSYTIHHAKGMKVPYSLTIIDTPGFGDTGGLERDKKITENISRFLIQQESQINEIDAICFVASCASARLTPTQKYIILSVMSLFGNDVVDNIRLLVTFSDGATPPVVEACKEAGFPFVLNPATNLPTSYNKFNNSVLFVNNQKSNETSFEKSFWNMYQHNCHEFFETLKELAPKKLDQTKEVNNQRIELEEKLKSLVEKLLEYFSIGNDNSELEQESKKGILKLLDKIYEISCSLKDKVLHSSVESVEDHLKLLDSRLEQENPGEYRREALNQLLNDWRKSKGLSEIEDDSSFDEGEPDHRVTTTEQENQQKDEAKPIESKTKRHLPKKLKTAKETILSLFRINKKVVQITKK